MDEYVRLVGPCVHLSFWPENRYAILGIVFVDPCDYSLKANLAALDLRSSTQGETLHGSFSRKVLEEVKQLQIL
jgi:hypothetical protein